jgi:hypothetical protein
MKNVLGEKNLSIAFERWNVLKALSMNTRVCQDSNFGLPWVQDCSYTHS